MSRGSRDFVDTDPLRITATSRIGFPSPRLLLVLLQNLALVLNLDLDLRLVLPPTGKGLDLDFPEEAEGFCGALSRVVSLERHSVCGYRVVEEPSFWGPWGDRLLLAHYELHRGGEREEEVLGGGAQRGTTS